MHDFLTVEENLRAAMRFFGYATGNGEIASLPGSVAMYSGLDYGVFNIAMMEGRVSHAGLTLEQRLAEVAHYFKPRTPRWSLWVCEDLLDQAVRRRARQTIGDFGLRAISHPPGMLASALLPPVTELPPIDLQPVGAGVLQRAFTEITSISFEIPVGIAEAVYAQDTAWKGQYRGFVGLAGGRPVSIVALVIAGDALGVYSLATHPAWRRKGYGEATMRAAVQQMVRDTGVECVVLQSTEAGYSLYKRMGFRDVTRFSVYPRSKLNIGVCGSYCSALLAQSPKLLEDGNTALDAKQYDRAIELFTQATAADPKDYAAQFQLALTYSLLGRDADAIPRYQAALALHPGMYEAELNLGMSLFRTNDPAGAISHFRAAVEQKPKEFSPAINLAQSLYNTQQFAEAEAAFKNAIALDPQSAAAESGLAMSLARQNRADDAAPHYQQAFVLDRSYRSGFVELAQLYEASGRTAEAVTFYRMFPDDPIALERIGILLTQAGQLPEAIQALEAVMEKMPTSARRIALAQAYVKSKQTAKAEAALTPAVEEAPGDFDLRMFYGRLLRDQRKFPGAVDQFAVAVRIKPDAAEAWSELASVLVIAQQYPQALMAFDRLRGLGAETTGHFFFRALAHDRLVQRPEAIDAYKKFLAAAQGKFPDRGIPARQRIRFLENELKKR